MSKDLEHVARAIDPVAWKFIDEHESDDPPHLVVPLTRKRMLNQARAALAAIREPSEEMWGGLARDIVMWCRFQRPTGHELYEHLAMLRREIPEWLVKEIPDNDHIPSKGTVAACIFKAMIDEVLK